MAADKTKKSSFQPLKIDDRNIGSKKLQLSRPKNFSWDFWNDLKEIHFESLTSFAEAMNIYNIKLKKGEYVSKVT